MTSPRVLQRLWLIACVAVFILGLAGLWWLCARNPKIAFLSRHETAEWVVYPSPYDPVARHVVEMNAVFRKSFVLSQPPAQATLKLRALRRPAVTINGAPVEVAGVGTNNWKDAAEFQVGGHLRAGTNEISITVYNDHGPPALWLALDAATVKLNTGPDWEASLEGAAWRHVRFAREPLTIEKGNVFFGGETALTSLRRQLPVLLFFAALSAIIFYGGRLLIEKLGQAGRAISPAELAVLVLGIFWIALFLNNRSTLPKSLGFDVTGHLAYVDFIKTHHALPFATDGWEMCQPPLYYLISAGVLWVLQLGTFTEPGIEMLRFLGLFAGIIQLRLTYQCLRLLFPKDSGKQLFGVILAGCLPAQLYISQYVTNESMVAVWVTGAIYFCLRIMIEERDSWRLALGAGLCLGAALLTKATALVALPFVGGALFGWLCLKRLRQPQAWVKTLGVTILATFIVSGWHYLRVWQHFGTPLVHDWDEVSGFAWWADDGFQTASYYGRFGESLIHPFQSVIHSFGDGIYSTLWGDGLYGAALPIEYRPPWNYDLMAAGYLLALLPMVVVLVGGAVSLAGLIRRPDPTSFMLVGLPFATLAALVYLNLKLPFFCGVKAFYGLLAIFPACAFGATGWRILTRHAGALVPVLYVALGVWALNSCAAVWIRGGTSATHAARGLHYSNEGSHPRALQQFDEALQLDPHNLIALRAQATEFFYQNRTNDAGVSIVLALQNAPDDAESHVRMAAILASQQNLEGAVKHALAAVESAPDLAAGYKVLATSLFKLKRNAEAITAAREGLRVQPTDAELQRLVGLALVSQGSHAEAARYFRHAVDLDASWAEAHDSLGTSLLALHRREAAVSQFQEAVKLKPTEGTFRLHLSEALGNQSR
jgi:Flp pilus assembly protein TadD